jgi:hypothetical protein
MAAQDAGETMSSQFIQRRKEAFLHVQLQTIYKRTDGMFAGLMIFQWLGAIVAAVLISPKTWSPWPGEYFGSA